MNQYTDRHAMRQRIEELEAQVERLQRIIDSRPAINAALPASYIDWSQKIYLLDFIQATGSHS